MHGIVFTLDDGKVVRMVTASLAGIDEIVTSIGVDSRLLR